MRRVRPFLDGPVGQVFDFRVMTDFGQGTAPLQDAYGDVHYWPELRLRGGKFKEPVGLERLQDDRYLMFVERALTVNLVPDRDIGAQLHGELFDNRIEYRFGLFNGAPDNTASDDIDNNDAKDFAGRLFFHPFAGTSYEFAQNLGFGIAGAYGRERASTLDIYRSAGQTVFFNFNKGVNASGDRYRIAPQANYYYGPLGMQAEFVDNVQRVRLATPSPAGTRPHTLSNQAWQIAGTYLLTGEDAQYGAPVAPLRNFNPYAGGLGAWELAARVDQLTGDREAFEFGEADPNTSSREALEYAVGANWYLNENVKLMADYARTNFIWGAANGHNRPVESAILSEFQVQF
jgi:phosphate-selective porin OprO/OprP